MVAVLQDEGTGPLPLLFRFLSNLAKASESPVEGRSLASPLCSVESQCVGT